jgi:hypothetical protein
VEFHNKEFIMSLANAAVNRLRELSRKVFVKNLRTNASRADYPARLHARAAIPLMEQLEPRVMLSGSAGAYEVLWSQQIGTSVDDASRAVAVDASGNSYVSGHTKGDIGGTNAGFFDAFVTKHDPSGAVVWSQQIGTTNEDYSKGVAVDGSGNVYITGYTPGDLEGTSAGNNDAFLTKFNSSGALQWTRQIGTSSSDISNAVAVDSSGNAYISGSTYGVLGAANLGESDAFLTKFSSSGTLQWTQQVGSTGYDDSYAVAVDGSGNLYISGATYGDFEGTNAGETDAFVTKFNSSGVVQWTQQIGSSSYDESYSVAVDGSGNVYISGSTYGTLSGTSAGFYDAFLAKFNSSGVVQWTEQLGTAGTDMSYAMAVDSSGNACISGYTNGDFSGANAGGNDAILVKFDTSGTELWRQQIGTDESDKSYGVAVDSSGNAYISGETYGDLGGTNAGGADAFLVKFGATSLFGGQQVITTSAANARDAIAVDVDGDGDLDVVSASYGDGKVAWFENTDAAGTFGGQQVITTNAAGASSLYATDFDGDGDMDILVGSFDADTVAWYENTDGAGTFTEHIITTLANGTGTVFAADLDGDGDKDVLSASMYDNKIAWYENTDGAGTFGAQQVITTSANSGRAVYAVDIDGDGDMDVLSASSLNHMIAWYENTDGAGTFGAQQAITTSATYTETVFAADLDGDGDMDVLSGHGTGEDGSEIVWFENTDGAGTFGGEQVITTAVDGVKRISTADLDGDGDQDVLSASDNDDKVAWYENDGTGTFGPQQLITTSQNAAKSVHAADLDGDGDKDILVSSGTDNTVAWYANSSPTPNLIITDTTPATLPTVAPGETVTLDITTKNDDEGNVASAFETQLFLSTDNTVTTGDTQVAAGAGAIASLAADATSVDTFTFNAPTTPGTYYLRAMADGGGVAGESAEDDNWGDLVTLIVSADTDLFDRAHAEDLGEVGNAAQVVKGAIGKTAINEDYNDWYEFTITGRRKITATLTGLKKNANIQLTDEDGMVLKTSAKKGTDNEKVVFSEDDVGSDDTTTFYLRVYTTSTKKTAYSLSVKAVNDTEKNGWAKATDLGTPGSKAVKVSDQFGGVDMNDWYKFKVKGVKRVTVRVDNMTSGVDMEYQVKATTAGVPDDDTIAGGKVSGGDTQSSDVRVLTAGTYYIRMLTQDTTTSSYRLRVSATGDTDFASRTKAKDTGKLGSTTKTYAGQLGAEDRNDWHKFTTTKTRYLTLELKNVNGDFDLQLCNAKGKVLETSAEDGATNESIIKRLKAGTYYARVFVRGSSNLKSGLDYTLELSATKSIPDN